MSKDKERNGRDKSAKASAKAEKKERVLTAKALLANAKANKRKWLCALIAIGLIAYFALSSGSLDLGGIMEWIKGIGGTKE